MAQYLGQVISTKMDKTVKVCVTSLRLHPVILKYWNHKKVYFAHDEDNNCNDGDYVLIKESRKLSKRKWFRVIDIVEKAPQITGIDPVQTLKEDMKERTSNTVTVEILAVETDATKADRSSTKSLKIDKFQSELQSLKTKQINETMDKFTFGGNLSFGKVKQRVQAAQQDLGASFKNIADKAKKEAKIVNKKARKALATEDGGDLREEYVLAVNLDAGHETFKRFQENWAIMHHESIDNVKRAEKVEHHVNVFTKQWLKYNEYLHEFHGNLLVLPDVIAKVEIAQKRIEAIGLQTKKVEELILQYEDSCERCTFEKQKSELKLKLSQLVETKSAEYSLKKNMLKGKADETLVSPNSSPFIPTEGRNPPELSRQQSQEKQKAYEDAFLDQMNQYIQFGELEKPIAGSVDETNNSNIEDIDIEDSDWSTLSEFLGPEELDSVKQAHSAVSMKKALSESQDTDKEMVTTEIQNQFLETSNIDIDTNIVINTEEEQNNFISEDIETDTKDEPIDTSNEANVSESNTMEENTDTIKDAGESDDDGDFYDADAGSSLE